MENIFSSFSLDWKQEIIILMLCCDVFLFLVKHGFPSNADLWWLSHRVEKWWRLGRFLRIRESTLDRIDYECGNIREKGYQMLLHWKAREGSAATYMVLHDALCHSVIGRRDLAEELREYLNLPQFTTGNMSLILQFNNNTITYKYSA